MAMNEFVCQNPSCRKGVTLDELLLEAAPTLSFSSSSLLEEVESSLREVEEQHNAEMAMNSQITPTKPKNNENRDNDGLFGSFQTARSISFNFFKLGRKDVNLPALETNTMNVNGGGNGIVGSSSPSSPNQLEKTFNDSMNHSINITYTTQEKHAGARSIFEFVSDSTRIDHPLCRECTVKLNRNLDRRISNIKTEKYSYEQSWNEIEKRQEGILSEEDLEYQIREMEEEEKELRKELKRIENDRQVLREEMKYIREEKERIEGIEENYFRHFAQFQQESQNYIDDHETVQMRLQNGTEELRRERETNIYNDTFHIWYDGHFGTINNFRLGRLPSQPVDWNEINAAWGQATLLLSTIARKMNFKFETYRLLPMGSSSKMEKISDGTHFELFGSSDISLGRLFWYRRFDNGMAAFLTCMAQIGEYAESLDKTFKLPYRIEKEKIGEMSIKLQFNNEETWTKSLKYLLTDLKFLLVFASKKIKTS